VVRTGEQAETETSLEAILRPPTNASTNVFEGTVERLGQLLKLGLIEPGARLPTERDLAATMAVSRTTVRAAIRVLADAGFLTVRRGKGGGTFVVEPPPIRRIDPTTSVSKIDSGAVDRFLDRRLVIEVGVAELAAHRSNPTHIESLLALTRELEASVDDLGRYRSLDAQFHIAIAETSGNPDLIRMVADIQFELDDLIGQLPASTRALRHANEQHSAMVDALTRSDPAQARTMTGEHVAATGHFIRGLLPRTANHPAATST